ncbi:MAG: DedA family protein [Solirubrobacteraceae bacterium]
MKQVRWALMLKSAAIIAVSGKLGYLLPAVIGLESLGVPSPGETALVLAAVLASQGKLQIWLVIVIGVASAILGDNIGYLLGRKLGREVLTTKGPLRSHRVKAIAAGDRFFERHGPKAVLLGRWVALVRVAVAWLAGINEMPFRQFLFWNALGAITWGTTVSLAGYLVGDAATKVFSQIGLIGAIVVGIALVGWFVVRKVRARRGTR